MRLRPAKRSIKMDPIHPRDMRELNLVYYCEQCSHFDHGGKTCTIGYDAFNHVKETQDKYYAMSGRVAYCRFQEID
jgi:hypothetical protein